MNNLAIILEQVFEARKSSNEQEVVDKLDAVIQTIIDMMKADPEKDLHPINYTILPPTADGSLDTIWRGPKELARETLGWQS